MELIINKSNMMEFNSSNQYPQAQNYGLLDLLNVTSDEDLLGVNEQVTSWKWSDVGNGTAMVDEPTLNAYNYQYVKKRPIDNNPTTAASFMESEFPNTSIWVPETNDNMVSWPSPGTISPMESSMKYKDPPFFSAAETQEFLDGLDAPNDPGYNDDAISTRETIGSVDSSALSDISIDVKMAEKKRHRDTIQKKPITVRINTKVGMSKPTTIPMHKTASSASITSVDSGLSTRHHTPEAGSNGRKKVTPKKRLQNRIAAHKYRQRIKNRDKEFTDDVGRLRQEYEIKFADREKLCEKYRLLREMAIEML